MTTALMAMFAACTNDDFISNGQGVQNGEAALRPTVGVTLNVLEGDGTDTRLGYENGYKWKEGDKIGALLMDEIRGYYEDNEPVRPFDDLEEWAEKPWTERYKLVDYVSTDYPFERQDDGTWTTNSKMLEGNYFFTFPFASYMGNREAVHSIGEQVQNGRDVATAYAQNQFFIGYSRIFAGTEGDEVMSSNLELTPVLGGIGITIVNNDDTPFTVKKVVLESKDFSTLIKIDPTQAKYVGEDFNNIKVDEPYYNIDKDKVKWWSTSRPDAYEKNYFNYANYEEVKNSGKRNEYGEVIWEAINPFGEMYKDGKWVNNTGRSANYMRQSALREIVNNVEESGHRAELTIENSPELGVRGQLQVMIMTTPYIYDVKKEDNPIQAWIYTDRGIAGPINITNVENAVSNGVTVNAENPITFVRPGRANSVTLMLHTNSIKMGASELDIYNEDDLKQLIEWNEGLNRIYKANLKADVVLDEEMSEMLMSEGWKSSNLQIVTGENYKVTLAEGVSKNILDKVLVKGNVEVEGELELGSKSFVNGDYTIAYADAFGMNSQEAEVERQVISIAEGATVNITSDILDVNEGNWRQDNVAFDDNEGTLNINATVKKFEIKNNEGKMNVNAEVTLNASSYNNAGGYITIAEGADLSGLTTDQYDKTYLYNKGTTHGDLLGDLRYNEENVEPAVIDNHGRLSGLVNKEYGKLIARAEAGPMVVVNNQAEAIIDITDDIEADVQFQATTNAGDVVYAVKAENTAKEIRDAKAGITALQMDGGKVTAPAADGDIALGAITKLRSTENGGVIGGDDAAIAFPSATSVEFNGALELNNVDLSGNYENIAVKSGTTTIKGNVNLVYFDQETSEDVYLMPAYSRGFVLASYNKQLLKEVDAELHISSDAVLKAMEVTRAELYATDANDSPLVDKTKAVVDNNGTVYLRYVYSSTALVDWRMKDPVMLEWPKPIAAEVVALKADQTFAELMDTYADLSKVKTIEISSDVSFDVDENSSAKVLEFLKDKEVVLKNGANLYDIKGTLGVAFKKLTVKGTNIVGSGSRNAAGGVMLTLDELEVQASAALTVNRSSILMKNVEQGEGFGSSYIQQLGSITYNDGGMITAKDAKGNLLGWNTTTKKWVNK